MNCPHFEYETPCMVCGKKAPLMMNVVNAYGAYPVCTDECAKKMALVQPGSLFGSWFRNAIIGNNNRWQHKRTIRIEI